jgi:hypothetical protein
MVLWIYFYTVKLSLRKFIVDCFVGIVHDIFTDGVYCGILSFCIHWIELEFLSVKLCVPSLMLKLYFISLKTT